MARIDAGGPALNTSTDKLTSEHVSPPRVLLVDDEAISRRLVRQHLPAHYEVVECEDAESAIREARSRQHDVALVDVLLPGLDGFALCRQLKGDSLTAEIPVILVTAKSGIEDLEQGFEAGATDYVRKPFNPRELRARVRNAVELKQRGDSLRRWNERVARDLALAGALQNSLLAPRPMLNEGMRIFTAYQPSIEVGGDFFDMLPLPDGRIAVYVGDVAGHGVGAAIASTLLKASLVEILRARSGAGPANICNELHQLFIQQLRAPGLYATLFLALIDQHKRIWTCMNCGHPAPIVIAPPGLKRCDFESRGGPPVGFCLAGPTPYDEESEISLSLPEDVSVMLITDGLLEAGNLQDPEASSRLHLAGLIKSWRKRRDQSPMEFILDGMRTAGFALGEDDCTALLVEQVPLDEVVLQESILLTAENLASLASRLEEVLRQKAWPDASSWASHLLLMEHGANVLRHGRTAPGSKLTLQVRLFEEAVELMIRDGGQPWKYEEATIIEAKASDDHGRGLMMISRMASYTASHRDGDENVTLFGVRRDWQVPP